MRGCKANETGFALLAASAADNSGDAGDELPGRPGVAKCDGFPIAQLCRGRHWRIGGAAGVGFPQADQALTGRLADTHVRLRTADTPELYHFSDNLSPEHDPIGSVVLLLRDIAFCSVVNWEV